MRIIDIWREWYSIIENNDWMKKDIFLDMKRMLKPDLVISFWYQVRYIALINVFV